MKYDDLSVISHVSVLWNRDHVEYVVPAGIASEIVLESICPDCIILMNRITNFSLFRVYILLLTNSFDMDTILHKSIYVLS